MPTFPITVCALTELRLDDAIQARVTLDPEVVDEYAAAMYAGDAFPPVVAFADGTVRWVADGFHRVHAARRAGVSTLPVETHDGTKRDAMLYAVGANQAHGLRRTNADKRRAVFTVLDDAQWRRWSDREIARQCGVSNNFVSEIRASLSSNDSDNRLTIDAAEPRTYTTKHGTLATMDTAPIAARSREPILSVPTPMAVHFSSETPEHYTPQPFLQLVLAVVGEIDLDPCSNTGTPNVPARQHFTAADNGLGRPWHGRVFMNPPYGREVAAWIAKLRAEWQRQEVTEAIALLPARTDTEWCDMLTEGTDDLVLCFLFGRLTFIGNTDPAPFPSLVAYFGPRHDDFARVFWTEGQLVVRPPRPWFVNHT